MRGWLLPPALLLITAGCQPRVVAPGGPIGPRPDSNFVLTVYEIVETPEDDVLAFTRVYIDGQLAGQTTAGPKSSEKFWETKLEPGNHLVRLERWASAGGGEPVKLSEEFQPRERFVRVETGHRTNIRLKFFDKGRRHVPSINRVSFFPGE